MRKIDRLVMAIEEANKLGDKKLSAKLTKELTTETQKNVEKSAKLIRDLEALNGKLKRS